MKFSRDTWIGIGILLAFILVTLATALEQSKAPSIPYLSTSSAPDGTLAFKLWLNELGYRPIEASQTSFNPSRSIKTILILQPSVVITEGEWKLIDQWVEQGGVLILAGDNPQTNIALEHFEFSIRRLQSKAVEISAVAPILNSPPIASKIPVQANFWLDTQRTDLTPLLSTNGQPVIMLLEQGKGRVILSSTPYLFSNLALKEDTTAVLVLNILALSGPKGEIWFDEWHHGFQMVGAENVVGPSQWLQNTPGGHAILFVVGVIFLALLLQGRTFGRPIPLAYEIKRRGPLEHVTAIANLNRKAGHTNEVLKQYHQRVKRHLGQRYRIDPSINDAEYVNALIQYNPTIDKDALLNLLKRLSQKKVNEAELLKLAAEAARWIND